MSLLGVVVPTIMKKKALPCFIRELTKNDPFFKGKEIELELLSILMTVPKTAL